MGFPSCVGVTANIFCLFFQTRRVFPHSNAKPCSLLCGKQQLQHQKIMVTPWNSSFCEQGNSWRKCGKVCFPVRHSPGFPRSSWRVMVDSKCLVTKDISFCFTRNSEDIRHHSVPGEPGSQQEPRSWALPPFWQENYHLLNHFERLQEAVWFATRLRSPLFSQRIS